MELLKNGLAGYFFETSKFLTENLTEFNTHTERLQVVRLNKRQKMENAVLDGIFQDFCWKKGVSI